MKKEHAPCTDLIKFYVDFTDLKKKKKESVKCRAIGLKDKRKRYK